MGPPLSFEAGQKTNLRSAFCGERAPSNVLELAGSLVTGVCVFVCRLCAAAAACEMLLRKGADVDAIAEPTGDTPLMTAAFCGNAAVMDVLLRAGADPEQERCVGVRMGGWAGMPCLLWVLHQPDLTLVPVLQRLTAVCASEQ